MSNRRLSTSPVLILVLAACIVASSQIFAEESRGKQVCEKLKSCTLKTLEQHEFPERTKQAIIVKLDQCATSYDQKEQAIIKADLVDEANACADEMIDMPCTQLMTPNAANNSRACKTYREASVKAGIED